MGLLSVLKEGGVIVGVENSIAFMDESQTAAHGHPSVNG